MQPNDPTYTPPTAAKKAPAKKAPAKRTGKRPAAPPAPVVDTLPADAAEQRGSDSAPRRAPAAANVGAIVTYQLEDDGPQVRGLVVGTVDGAEHRDAGLSVVPLADSVVIPLDAVKD